MDHLCQTRKPIGDFTSSLPPTYSRHLLAGQDHQCRGIGEGWLTQHAPAVPKTLKMAGTCSLNGRWWHPQRLPVWPFGHKIPTSWPPPPTIEGCVSRRQKLIGIDTDSALRTTAAPGGALSEWALGGARLGGDPSWRIGGSKGGHGSKLGLPRSRPTSSVESSTETAMQELG